MRLEGDLVKVKKPGVLICVIYLGSQRLACAASRRAQLGRRFFFSALSQTKICSRCWRKQLEMNTHDTWYAQLATNFSNVKLDFLVLTIIAVSTSSCYCKHLFTCCCICFIFFVAHARTLAGELRTLRGEYACCGEIIYTSGKVSFHPQYWSTVSDEAKDLIQRMLTLDKVGRSPIGQERHAYQRITISIWW